MADFHQLFGVVIAVVQIWASLPSSLLLMLSILMLPLLKHGHTFTTDMVRPLMSRKRGYEDRKKR